MSTIFKKKYTYQVKIISHNILLPEQSEYSNLPSLNSAIETLLITLIEKRLIEVQNGILVKV